MIAVFVGYAGRANRPGVPGGICLGVSTKQAVRDTLNDRRRYIRRFGEDILEIREWKWNVNQAN